MKEKDQKTETPIASPNFSAVLSCADLKKNCFNCKHLEWIDIGCEYGSGAGAGYCCNKRNYRSEIEEDNHLGQLEKDEYLKKGKSCCELKAR
jgi:hypothetical protein